jgi:hypothetical protein
VSAVDDETVYLVLEDVLARIRAVLTPAANHE